MHSYLWRIICVVGINHVKITDSRNQFYRRSWGGNFGQFFEWASRIRAWRSFAFRSVRLWLIWSDIFTWISFLFLCSFALICVNSRKRGWETNKGGYRRWALSLFSVGVTGTGSGLLLYDFFGKQSLELINFLLHVCQVSIWTSCARGTLEEKKRLEKNYCNGPVAYLFVKRFFPLFASVPFAATLCACVPLGGVPWVCVNVRILVACVPCAGALIDRILRRGFLVHSILFIFAFFACLSLNRKQRSVFILLKTKLNFY